MTKRTIYIILSVFLLTLSCQKEQPNVVDDQISFHVYTPLDIATKAEVTDESIKETSVTSVYVYESLQNLFGTSGSLLSPEKNTKDEYSGRWLPSGDRYWGNDTWDVNYQFWGWAYSPAGSSDISVIDAGKTVTIKQPDSYSGDYIDYLLSYIHSEPALSSADEHRKSIPLAFEHALTMVDIYLYRAHSMADNASANLDVYILVNELTLGKIYNVGQISCNSHAFRSANQQQNIWSVTNKSGSVNYSRKDIADGDIKERDDAILAGPMMRFISIPVTNADMQPNDRYKLMVKYTVTVKNTNTGSKVENTYTETFDLSSVTPAWQSGHRVKYELCISSGIELTGSIVDWIDVEYVEGVVLPDKK